MFQSLRGFGVGWSSQLVNYERDRPQVSIPERVWGGLERWLGAGKSPAMNVSIPERVWGGLEQVYLLVSLLTFLLVSIPERVWGGLEQAARLASMGAISTFQSLRGFGVGWSVDRPTADAPVKSFNP